jgi:hypothetical protein
MATALSSDQRYSKFELHNVCFAYDEIVKLCLTTFVFLSPDSPCRVVLSAVGPAVGMYCALLSLYLLSPDSPCRVVLSAVGPAVGMYCALLSLYLLSPDSPCRVVLSAVGPAVGMYFCHLIPHVVSCYLLLGPLLGCVALCSRCIRCGIG